MENLQQHAEETEIFVFKTNLNQTISFCEAPYEIKGFQNKLERLKINDFCGQIGTYRLHYVKINPGNMTWLASRKICGSSSSLLLINALKKSFVFKYSATASSEV